MELATQLTNRIIQILPQRRSELAEMYKKAQTLRAAVVQSTGQEEHDETYKSLCRYWLKFIIVRFLCFIS